MYTFVGVIKFHFFEFISESENLTGNGSSEKKLLKNITYNDENRQGYLLWDFGILCAVNAEKRKWNIFQDHIGEQTNFISFLLRRKK